MMHPEESNRWDLGIFPKDSVYESLRLEEYGESFYEIQDHQPLKKPLPSHWYETTHKHLLTNRKDIGSMCHSFEMFGRCLVPVDSLVKWMVAEIRGDLKEADSFAIQFDPTKPFFAPIKFKRTDGFLGQPELKYVLAASSSSKKKVTFQVLGGEFIETPLADPSIRYFQLGKSTSAKIESNRKGKKLSYELSSEEWTDLVARASLLHSASLLGLSTRTLELASTHAQTRVVSGNPIGRYQAISHTLASMLVEVEKLRSVIAYAAEAHGSQEFLAAVAMAKSISSRLAVDNTQKAIQIFGAKGFQWGFPLNFFLRRSLVGASLFGTASEHNSFYVSQIVADRSATKTNSRRKAEDMTVGLASISFQEGEPRRGEKEVFQ